MSGNVTSGSAETQWIDAVLKDLGAPASANNVTFFRNWITVENDKYGYNPLGTTYNSNGIGHYASLQQGAAATANTLKLGYSGYSNIVSGLKTSKPLSYYTYGPGESGLMTWDPNGGDVKNLRSLFSSGGTGSLLGGNNSGGSKPSGGGGSGSTQPTGSGFLYTLNELLNPTPTNFLMDVASLGTVPLGQTLTMLFVRGVLAIVGLMVFFVGLKGLSSVASGTGTAATIASNAVPGLGEAMDASKVAQYAKRLSPKYKRPAPKKSAPTKGEN